MVGLKANRYQDLLDDSNQGVMREEGYFKQPLPHLSERKDRLALMISGLALMISGII